MNTKLDDSLLLDDNLKSFQQRVVELCNTHIKPIADETDRNSRFPREIWPVLGAAGLLGVTIPKKYQGSELGFFEQILAIEEISRASGGIGLSYTAHANLCAHHLYRFANEMQREKYLPKLNSGEWVGGIAMSERTAGSDVMSMQMHAREKENHYVLNGHKMWITNGPDADVLLVYAKTNPEAGAHGITCFIIEKHFPGFRANTKLNKLGMRSSNTAELFFENCCVPKENILGKVNEGLKLLIGGLDIERAVISAAPLGLMHACLDVMLPYVKNRKQFNRSLGEFQMIQTKIADAYTHFQASRHFVYSIAKLCDQNKIKTEQAAAAYLFTSEQATKMALDTIQCMGGYGYLNDFEAGRLLRDAKLYEIGAGTTEIRRIVIARELLK